MTPYELANMRNPLSIKNVRRIRKLLNTISFKIDYRSRDMIEVHDWFREISDELCACRAILYEWNCRKKGGAK